MPSSAEFSNPTPASESPWRHSERPSFTALASPSILPQKLLLSSRTKSGRPSMSANHTRLHLLTRRSPPTSLQMRHPLQSRRLRNHHRSTSMASAMFPTHTTLLLPSLLPHGTVAQSELADNKSPTAGTLLHTDTTTTGLHHYHPRQVPPVSAVTRGASATTLLPRIHLVLQLQQVSAAVILVKILSAWLSATVPSKVSINLSVFHL